MRSETLSTKLSMGYNMKKDTSSLHTRIDWMEGQLQTLEELQNFNIELFRVFHVKHVSDP